MLQEWLKLASDVAAKLNQSNKVQCAVQWAQTMIGSDGFQSLMASVLSVVKEEEGQ